MTQTLLVDPRLLEGATELQRTYIEAANRLGSFRAAARELNKHPDQVRSSIRSLERRMNLRGLGHFEDGPPQMAPQGFGIKGTSTLYDRNGEVAARWVKTKREDDMAEEIIREFIEDLAVGIKGTSPITPAPQLVYKDLLAVYPMGDPHFGLYAIAEETGDDFNLETAERDLCAAIDRLVECTAPAETAVILNLGDFFHTDNSSNQTSRSKNALDVDGRWPQIMKIGLRAMIYCISRALQKHQTVIVRNVKGNHDDHSSFALALALDCYFSNNDRVKIEMTTNAFWYLRWGKVLIGATHGHEAKPADLPGIMACDRAEDWGVTKFRYWYHGHIHHKAVKEYPGVIVESFNTLAARDAWHSGEGYRAGRDMLSILLHCEYGEVERHRCDIGMLKKAA